MAASSLSGAFDEILGPINTYIVNPVITLLFALAILIFLWGVVQMLMNAESEDGRKKGAQHMLWGVIGIAIMISAYGIINFISTSLLHIQDADRAPTTIPR